MKNKNSYNSEDIIEINNQKFKYFDLNKAAEYFALDLSKTPVSIKIIIENLARSIRDMILSSIIILNDN